VLSTFYYLTYVDDLLNDLENSNLGCRVLSTKCGNPTYADDIALIALSPLNLQRMVDIVFSNMNEWRCDISVKKSNVIVFSKMRNPPDAGIMYGIDFFEQTNSTVHLGIRQDSNLKIMHRINERCQKAKNALFAISAQVLHPYGLNPLVSVKLYKKIIVPIALYGCKLWHNMSYREIVIVNRLQHGIVKRILGLPMRTRSDMCESITCCHKLYSNVVIRKWMFLHKILSLDVHSTTRNIFVKRYMLYTSYKTVIRGFIPDICRILCIYGLQTFINNVLICPTALPS